MAFDILQWLPNAPWDGPPVPRWMLDSWAQFWALRKREFTDLQNELSADGTPTVLPDLLYLTFKSISSAAADWAFAPGTLAKWVAVLDQQVAREGKFTQLAVFYKDISPPPFLYDYKCRKCARWGPNQGQADRTCLWVSGDISPEGWCGIWVPNTDQQPFTWPKQLVQGDW